jgi:hypothetical protein
MGTEQRLDQDSPQDPSQGHEDKGEREHNLVANSKAQSGISKASIDLLNSTFESVVPGDSSVCGMYLIDGWGTAHDNSQHVVDDLTTEPHDEGTTTSVSGENQSPDFSSVSAARGSSAQEPSPPANRDEVALSHFEQFIRTRHPEMLEEQVQREVWLLAQDRAFLDYLIGSDEFDKQMLKIHPDWRRWFELR